MKNCIVFSEYSFEEFISHTNDLNQEFEYIDARNLPSKEIEVRWIHEENKCFFLGTNGMPCVDLDDTEQVWIFDASKADSYYPLNEFIDISRFNIIDSWDAYKHFRAGRFGGHKKWDWSNYMIKNVYKKDGDKT